MKFTFSDRVLSRAILLIPLLYLVLLALLGAHSFYIIFDNLDSEVAFRTVLKNAGMLFSSSITDVVPNVMQGLPRNAFNASAWSIISILFGAFSTLQAYQCNEVLVRLIGLMGTYFMCTRVLLPAGLARRLTIAALLAVSLSLSQAYMLYGITVLGVPSLVVTWDLLRKNGRWQNWVIASFTVVVYAFYSSLVLFGYALLVTAPVLACMLYFQGKKRDAWVLAFMTFLLGLAYIPAEQNLLKAFLLQHDFVSHRNEFMQSIFARPWASLPGIFTKTLLVGHMHSEYPALVAFFLSALTLWLSFKNKAMPLAKPMLIAFSGCIALALLHTLYISPAMEPIKDSIQILRMFIAERFFFAFPVMWTITLAFSAPVLAKFLPHPQRTVPLLFCINMLYVLTLNPEVRFNVESLLPGTQTQSRLHTPWILATSPQMASVFESYPMATWEQFYAEQLFTDIDSHYPLIRSKGRIACLGFFPSIAQVNGFSTVDSYQNNYALEYKHQFRKVIAPELALSSKYREYFDSWGSRCFLMSHEIADLGYIEKPFKGYYITDPNLVLHDLRIDISALSKIGASHIFSAVQIQNSDMSHLLLLGHFRDPHTPLQIYVYEIS